MGAGGGAGSWRVLLPLLLLGAPCISCGHRYAHHMREGWIREARSHIVCARVGLHTRSEGCRVPPQSGALGKRDDGWLIPLLLGTLRSDRGGGGKPRPQPHTVPYAPLPLFTGSPCPWSQPTETLVTGSLGKGWASRMLFSNDGVITAVPMQEPLTGPRSLLSSGNKDRGAKMTVAIFMPLSCPPPPRGAGGPCTRFGIDRDPPYRPPGQGVGLSSVFLR